MIYDIFQINLTPAEVNEINRLGFAEAGNLYPRVKAHTDIMFGRNAAEHFKAGHYTKVAVIEAEDLEDVFEIGNGMKEGNITRLDKMHSVSVGDVVKDETGVYHSVASMGYDVLEV